MSPSGSRRILKPRTDGKKLCCPPAHGNGSAPANMRRSWERERQRAPLMGTGAQHAPLMGTGAHHARSSSRPRRHHDPPLPPLWLPRSNSLKSLVASKSAEAVPCPPRNPITPKGTWPPYIVRSAHPGGDRRPEARRSFPLRHGLPCAVMSPHPGTDPRSGRGDRRGRPLLDQSPEARALEGKK